jgi:hypothetical protein
VIASTFVSADRIEARAFPDVFRSDFSMKVSPGEDRARQSIPGIVVIVEVSDLVILGVLADRIAPTDRISPTDDAPRRTIIPAYPSRATYNGIPLLKVPSSLVGRPARSVHPASQSVGRRSRPRPDSGIHNRRSNIGREQDRRPQEQVDVPVNPQRIHQNR